MAEKMCNFKSAERYNPISFSNPNYYLLYQSIAQNGTKVYTTSKRVKQALLINIQTNGSNDAIYFIDCEKKEVKVISGNTHTYNNMTYSSLVVGQTDTTITIKNSAGTRYYSFFAWF